MLIIDNREGKLIELIKATPTFKIPYELQSLQIGDIIISSEKHLDKSIIIERKCVQDMLASIKDGRYKEQKIRLQAEKCNSNGNKLICYLIEGSSSDVRYPSEKTVFHGSIVSSIFRDEIPLIRTSNLNETLDIIIRIHERMSKDITDFFKANTKPIPSTMPSIMPSIMPSTINNSSTINDSSIINKEEENNMLPETTNDSSISENNIITNENNITNTQINNTYLNSIKKCKKENLTPQLWNQISLTNIPGVSTSIATKISEVFPTLKKLFEAYDNCELNEERILLISEIILTDNGKTKRRIGEVVSKRIIEYLYN